MNEPIGCTKCGGNDHTADECKRFAGELLACPFCGNEPTPYWNGVGCATSGCILNGLHLDFDKWQARAAQPEPVVPEGSIYVECRQCDKCQHVGINDAAHGLAACHDCDWSGNEPEDDKCPGCKSENCMAAACPECGARYALIASEDVAAAPAQGQQVECQDAAAERNAMQRQRDQARALLAKECSDADQVLRVFGIDPDDARTDGGFLNVDKVRELSALKAQQVGQEPALWARQCDLDESDPALFVSRERVEESGYTVPFYPHQTNSVEGEPVGYTTTGMLAIAKELPLTGRIGARCKADERWNVPLYTAPQPAPAQDVAVLVRALESASAFIGKLTVPQNREQAALQILNATTVLQDIGAALAAHDKQSGGEV